MFPPCCNLYDTNLSSCVCLSHTILLIALLVLIEVYLAYRNFSKLEIVSIIAQFETSKQVALHCRDLRLIVEFSSQAWSAATPTEHSSISRQHE